MDAWVPGSGAVASTCALALAMLMGCSDGADEPPPPCVGPIEAGDPNGHADPFGAKAAGQARAARLANVSVIAQPAHGRQPIQDGDFILVNDKIAVAIEDGGLSDGYGRFGGEILAIDKIGDDGKPMGLSKYVETLMGFGLTEPDPSSVSVTSDGSDGGEAVVRVVGRTKVIPFLDGSLAKLFPSDFDLEVAFDYVLEPGAEHLLIRVSVANPDPEPLDFGVNKAGSDEIFGFFHGNHNALVTEGAGFDPKLDGMHPWVGFVGGQWGFAWRMAEGDIEYGINQSGFSLFNGPGWEAAGCSITTSDRVEVIAGGPWYDGLRETIRRVDGEPAWRAISGVVRDGAGAPVPRALVHELDADDLYQSRVESDENGAYTIHAPPGELVRLVAQAKGLRHDGTDVSADTEQTDLSFLPHATIHVTATRMGDARPLPVRIQVVPTTRQPVTPEEYGVLDERHDRLHQEFAITGDATLLVPPGAHQVLVSRGYEYELSDQTVTVAAGETAEVAAVLEHSVDSTGVMCADFHIHSIQSADSSDPIDYKVKGAIADGLDIPVSSEHEWVVDFGPIVESLGMGDWAFGSSSSELTTFTWGHFGVVPLVPRPGAYNNGAVDWLFKTPAEVFATVDALEEAPALIVNHPRGGIGGYFSSVNLDKASGTAHNTELWSDNFDAIEVFNSSTFDDNRDGSVRDWFNLLNTGMRVFAVGSSDSHSLRSSPVGYARTCFFFGHDDPRQLTREAVRDAVLSGNSIVSGGLMMTVTGPNGERPGASVSPGAATFTVTVEAPSFVGAQDLEVIVRGNTVRTEPLMPLGTGTSNRWVNQVTLDLAAGDWVVLHARGSGDLSPLHPGRTPFAVSNPIFVQ